MSVIKYLESTSYNVKFIDLMKELYNKYGEEIFNLSGIGKQLDINVSSKNFFKTNKVSDVSVDSNANVSDNSVIGYVFESAKPYHLLNSYYRLWKWLLKNRGNKYANEIIEKQISGAIYINDFTGLSSARSYCNNYTAFDTAILGVPNEFDGKGGSKPPKSIMSFLGQQELVSLFAGNSTLGAVGLSDLLIVLSIYVQKALKTKKDAHINLVLPGEEYTYTTEIDKPIYGKEIERSHPFMPNGHEILGYEKTKKQINVGNVWQYVESMLTGFIYRLNQPYRGNQALFTNISLFDRHFLENLCKDYILEIDNVVYTADISIVKKLQQIYIDIMNRELERKPLTFPITTACFSIDKENNILDNNFLEVISEKNLKFGFMNIFAGKTSTISACCRLKSDSNNEYFNSFGAGSTKIGSCGVCTINMPQLAERLVMSREFEYRQDYLDLFLDRLKYLFLDRLKYLVIDCQEVNNAKRNIIKRVIKNGNHPLYSTGFININRQYNTLGIVGLNESLEILGLNILEREGQDFVIKILNVINETNDELQKRFKAPHNCEQVPAENLAVKLAQKDKYLGYNNEYDLYSNQFIPLTSSANLLDRIKLQGMFDKHFSGGAICHLNMDQEITDVNKMKNLIISSIKQGVIYFAINYVLQKCEKSHFTVGNIDICNICGSKIIEKYTRIVGFLSKISDWNKTRRELDFPNRQMYSDIEE